MRNGLMTESSLVDRILCGRPPAGAENFQKMWKQERMQSFKHVLRRYNNKDFVPTLEAIQKMVEFHHNKGIDELNFGLTNPNLANFFLNSSTSAKYQPITEIDKTFFSKVREVMVAGPSIVCTRKTLVDETHIRMSINVCNLVVGIDASHLYPYSKCQPSPTGLYTGYEFDADLQSFKTRLSKSRSFEIMVLSYCQRMRSD